MIASMDENIGKIIKELKDQGLYENTIIMFMSDNGGLSTSEGSATSNLPLRGGKVICMKVEYVSRLSCMAGVKETGLQMLLSLPPISIRLF